MTRVLHRAIGAQLSRRRERLGHASSAMRTASDYIDASGGAAVSCLGHGHPDVLAAMHAQLDRLAYAHTSFFTTAVAEELADDLVAHAPPGIGHVYFVCGGSEAIEAALKMARQYFVERASRSGGTSSPAARAITATRWARWRSAATSGGARSSRRC